MSIVRIYDTSKAAQQSLGGGVLGLASSVLARVRNRRQMNYLLSLPDYQLKDIGLQRGDIQREALKPLWRD
jgi:uncharacterized protein YjiS (DUF1127 family)